VDYRIVDYYPACKLLAGNSNPVTLLVHLNDGGTNSYFLLRDYPLGNARLEAPVAGSTTISYGSAISTARLALRGYCE